MQRVLKRSIVANRIVKELREAHNIEKMYKAGSFGLVA